MTWIKICGMTSAEAVGAALEAQVDALGFVFATSPRQLTPARALQLAAPARGHVACVAVMHHPSQASVDEVVRQFRPDVIQTDAEDLLALRLPEELEVLPVFRHWQDDGPGGVPRRVLFEGPRSGVGLQCDWSSARALSRRTDLVLAGGLNAENVSSAMTEVRPFGVDVSSGVEQRPGLKDPVAIARFVAAVRAQDGLHAPD